jgi:hypothetical protein
MALAPKPALARLKPKQPVQINYKLSKQQMQVPGRSRVKSEQQFYNRWFIAPEKKFIRKESQSNYKK